MKFLHLAAADHGGAGIAAWRMHDALRSLGHGSRMLVLEGRSTDADVLALEAEMPVFRWQRLAHKAWLRLATRPEPYFQNQSLSPHPDAAALLARLGGNPDIIVVHSISHFLNAHDVLALQQASAAPVLWNLLDMGLMTGGCHYAWNCLSYAQRCGACPALRASGPADASARIWIEKHDAMSRTEGWVVAGSSLLARQAQTSSLLRGRHIETLLLGVSPDKFAPGDPIALRSKLGLGDARDVLFFGAQKFSQKRKGMDLLLAALLKLADHWPANRPLPALLSAGNASDFASARSRGYELRELGHVGTDMLARCYAAADLFACPSIEDSGPMMINESLMSGTPVVAFRMGVAEDLIEDGLTGVIAPLADVDAFAAGLRRVLDWSAEQRHLARQRCRAIALERCDPHRQLHRFVEMARRLRADCVVRT